MVETNINDIVAAGEFLSQLLTSDMKGREEAEREPSLLTQFSILTLHPSLSFFYHLSLFLSRPSIFPFSLRPSIFPFSLSSLPSIISFSQPNKPHSLEKLLPNLPLEEEVFLPLDRLLQVTILLLHSVYLDLLVGVDPVVLAFLEVEVVVAVEVGEVWSKVGEENWVVGWVDESEIVLNFILFYLE